LSFGGELPSSPGAVSIGVVPGDEYDRIVGVFGIEIKACVKRLRADSNLNALLIQGVGDLVPVDPIGVQENSMLGLFVRISLRIRIGRAH